MSQQEDLGSEAGSPEDPPPPLRDERASAADPGMTLAASHRDLQPLAGPASEQRFLAHYQISGEVGRGGMGTVYRALDTLLDREVAVKVLSSELSDRDGLQERFVREAKIVARLAHPNIPHIYFIGRAAGRLFFAMEWIEGETLDSRLRRRPLPVEQALDIAHQVANGLDFAHRAGVVHRDVKPSNVMLTQDGVAKVLDFGIARSVGIDSTTTMTGQFIGTPHYASPEQARGEKLDARSDIYSLGATLYEMIAGRPPFTGDNPLAVLTDRLLKPPPEIPPEIDCEPSVRQLVRRMLATNPEERYTDCRALLRDIEAASPGPVAPARFAPRAAAAGIDLLLAGLPLVVAFAIFFLTTKYFPTTLLYDSILGRVGLGAALFAWLLGYFVHAAHRWGGTPGMRVERLRVLGPDGKDARRSRLLRRALLLWGPVCLALALQPDLPPEVRYAARGDGIEVALPIQPLMFVILWFLGLGLVPAFHPRRRHLVDWLAGTVVVETQRRASGTSPMPAGPGGARARLRRVLVGQQGLANLALLTLWIAIVVLMGLQFRGFPGNDAAGKIFETVRPGAPGVERIWERFQAELLHEGATVLDRGQVTFHRGLFDPTPHADIDVDLVLANRVCGSKIHYSGSSIRAMSGRVAFGRGDTWSEEMTPVTKTEAMEWDGARRWAYCGSHVHFLRALMHQRLKAEGFEVLDPENFRGLFRLNEREFLLVAEPGLHVRVPCKSRVGYLALDRGFLTVTNSGETYRRWHAEDAWAISGVPGSALQAYADEQDSIWGRSTASIEKVLELR